MAGSNDVAKVEAGVDKLALFLFLLALQGVYYLGNSIASDRRRGVSGLAICTHMVFCYHREESTRRGTNMEDGTLVLRKGELGSTCVSRPSRISSDDMGTISNKGSVCRPSQLCFLPEA